MRRSALCRSRRELSNAYLLAKIGVDTAENEPLEVWGENSIQYSLHSLVAGQGWTPYALPRVPLITSISWSKPRWSRYAVAESSTRTQLELYKARSRLYRSQILQVNVRLKALAEIYTMHSFAQLLESIIENWGKKDLAKTTPKIGENKKTRGQ